MSVREGLVGKIKVSVLRDSGCNSVLIKDKLVKAKEYTEKKVTCILADGTTRVCPVARINMITPFYVGQVEALNMDNPVYDLIIGNITGARSADNPNLDWKNEVSCDVPNLERKNEVSSSQSNLNKEMVQQEVNEGGTNTQQIKNCMETFLEVHELNKEVSREQARQCQESDEKLSDMQPIESSGEVKACREGSNVKYFIKLSWHNKVKVNNVSLMKSSLALQQFKIRLEASKAVTNLWPTFELKVEGIEATVDKEINIEHEKNDYNHFFSFEGWRYVRNCISQVAEAGFYGKDRFLYTVDELFIYTCYL